MEVNKGKSKPLTTARPSSPDEILNRSDYLSRFWLSVFLKSMEINCSDIHIEPFKDSMLVRGRVNGSLLSIVTCPDGRDTVRSLTTRLKLICGLDLSTTEKTQDKSLSLSTTGARYRIALSPTVFGESIVFRIIKDDDIPSLDRLKLPEQTLADFKTAISQKQGFICITGPTGSGKSTTLQAALYSLDRERKKVISIENPVERTIPFVIQKEITPHVGWKMAIKMALREDPDVILIGEVRDAESAELALEAAQTGHLVMTTLHTNNVAGLVDRLIGLGVEKRLIADNLLFASAQRLIPTLCPCCKRSTANGLYLKGDGCDHCSITGRSGIVSRTPIVEYSFKPCPESILNFNKKNFIDTQLKTSLQTQLGIRVACGIVCRSELDFWS